MDRSYHSTRRSRCRLLCACPWNVFRGEHVHICVIREEEGAADFRGGAADPGLGNPRSRLGVPEGNMAAAMIS